MPPVVVCLLIILIILLVVRGEILREKQYLQAQVRDQPIVVHMAGQTPVTNCMLAKSADTLPSAYTIIIESTCDCPPVHKLYSIFDHAKKEFEGTDIEFRRDTVKRAKGVSYPRIVKIRRNKDILEYTGANDYAAVADWIRNESLLA